MAVALITAPFGIFGCVDNMAQQNAIQLQQEQQQIDDLQHQLDALKEQQQKFYSLSSRLAGGCDQAVMHDATQRGDVKLDAHDYERAMAYYRDAASACPNSAQVEVNIARAYEAMGERDRARVHYQRAVDLGKGMDAVYGQQARDALSRLAATR